MHWRVDRTVRYLREHLSRPHPCPVLVFGNQKSGTSAVAGMLGKITGASVSLDLMREYQAPTYPEVVAGERTIRSFIHRNRLEFSRTIVKEPDFLVLWHSLLAEFPESPRILVIRDPRDNIRSILDRLDLPGDREALTPQERAANGSGWALYLDGHWLGLEAEHYIEVMAHRWNLGYEFLKANWESMILIHYEAFLRDKEGLLTAAAKAAGLSVRRRLGAAAECQYQPRGRSEIDWLSVFGEENLERIERICAEGMVELGYKRLGEW